MADNVVPADRIWASQWYRVTPRSFVHEELFFDPKHVLRVFAGESYKSLLLRQDGREQHAHELGDEYVSVPAEQLTEDDRTDTIPANTIETITIQSGSLLRKPRLRIETADAAFTYYHFSRRHDVEPLATELRTQYADIEIVLDDETI